MGLAKSKLPSPLPGQLLLLIGIQEFDNYYSGLEPTIRTLENQRIEVDLHLTDLINSMGAGEVWEACPKPEILIKMILTIISTYSNGYIYKLVVLSHDHPYIELKAAKAPRSLRKILANYTLLITSISNIHLRLDKHELSESIVGVSENLQDEITKFTIKNNYSMKDKVEAVKRVNDNRSWIEKVPREYKEMISIYRKFPKAVRKVISESQSQPYADIYMQRGVQAASENLRNPREIVNKFWPIV